LAPGGEVSVTWAFIGWPIGLESSSVKVTINHFDVKPVADCDAELVSPLTEGRLSAVKHVSGAVHAAEDPSPGSGAASTGAASKPGPGLASKVEVAVSPPASPSGGSPLSSPAPVPASSSRPSLTPLVAQPTHAPIAMGRHTRAMTRPRIHEE
jgi:hypothetical protein